MSKKCQKKKRPPKARRRRNSQGDLFSPLEASAPTQKQRRSEERKTAAEIGVEIKRAPFGLKKLESETAILLGWILELRTKTHRFVFQPNASDLIFFPKSRIIAAKIRGGRSKRVELCPDLDNPSAVEFEKWANRTVTEAKELTIPTDEAFQWTKLGKLSQIDYGSTKWGERAEYTHTVEHEATLYSYGGKYAETLFIVGLDVTARGIEG